MLPQADAGEAHHDKGGERSRFEETAAFGLHPLDRGQAPLARRQSQHARERIARRIVVKF